MNKEFLDPNTKYSDQKVDLAKMPGVLDFIRLHTQEAVDNWLTAHPEATTTVQDESLTYNKLVKGTLNFVTPEMYGAMGDGATDDTTAITNALASGFMVVFGEKTYAVSNTISIPSDSILCFGNTIIKNNSPDACVKILNAKNVTFIGELNIVGNNTHTSEYKHGLSIVNSQNISIEKVCSFYNNGDGIYIGQSDGVNENISIDYCEVSHNSRNGLSIIGGIGINIGYLTGEGNVYNSPKALFDIEPNNANDNVVVTIDKVVDKNTFSSYVVNKRETTKYNVTINEYYSETTYLAMDMKNTANNCKCSVNKMTCVASDSVPLTCSGDLYIKELTIQSTSTSTLFYFDVMSNAIIDSLIINSSSAIGFISNSSGQMLINSVTDRAGIPSRRIANINLTVNSINNFTSKTVAESSKSGLLLFDNYYVLTENCTELRFDSSTLFNNFKCTIVNDSENTIKINLSNANSILRPDGTMASYYNLEAGKKMQFVYTLPLKFARIEAVY